MASKGCTFALSLVAAVLLVGAAAIVEGECNVDKEGLLSQCLRFVTPSGPKQPPSSGCCNVVKNTDINCACQLFGRKLPVPISMDKVCYVASMCRNPLKPGTHCGNYTVPAAC